MAAQGQNKATAEIALLRKDSREGGMPMSYDRQGVARQVQGDDDAPFGKSPPFPSDRDGLLDVDELPTDAYIASELIDVEAVHLVTVWLDATAVEDGSIISMIPEVRDTENADFVPTSVLSSAIAVVNLPGEGTTEFGSREFFPTEIRSRTLSPAERLRLPITFDVGAFKQFRLRAADVGNQIGTGASLLLSASKSD